MVGDSKGEMLSISIIVPPALKFFVTLNGGGPPLHSHVPMIGELSSACEWKSEFEFCPALDTAVARMLAAAKTTIATGRYFLETFFTFTGMGTSLVVATQKLGGTRLKRNRESLHRRPGCQCNGSDIRLEFL